MYTKTELLNLYNLPVEELFKKSKQVFKENFKDEVEFCSIISAKTGKCEENCKYCAQSSHYRTDITNHPMLSLDKITKAALEAKSNGAKLFSVVTSGRELSAEDFDGIVNIIRELVKIEDLKICASLGFLSSEQVQTLKDAGLTRYHHNINTCESYHDEICSTHSYKDRTDTVNLVKDADLEVCCGVIIGMGESREQRAEMILELAKLSPDSVPVNVLNPVEGTPFEDYNDKINEEEILKTLFIFRIALPKTLIRYAGGRVSRISRENQELGLKGGINAMMVGNYLTTIGILPEDDRKFVEDCGLAVAKA